jgi:hypothetical protein
MSKIAIFVLALAVETFGIATYYQFRLVQELRARIATVSKAASPELQQKCADQAREVFSHDVLASKDPLSSFTDHYNTELNRCFVLIHSSVVNAKDGTVLETNFLSDAYERKSYAVYRKENDKVICSVALPSGEKAACHSTDEFDDLIRAYMQ